jgi:hypothetical protein
MEIVFRLPFNFLAVPNLKIRKPSWVAQPSAMVVFSLALFSYFLVTAGVIYDVIVEPPGVGSTVDERGVSRPVAFMPYRVNGQYILEGLASSFLFTVGGLGFIILYRTNNTSGNLKPQRSLGFYLMTSVGFICVLVSVLTTHIFMKMKLPGYYLHP